MIGSPRLPLPVLHLPITGKNHSPRRDTERLVQYIKSALCSHSDQVPDVAIMVPPQVERTSSQKNAGDDIALMVARQVEQTSSQNADDGTTAPKETTYSDPSGAIFSMYITRALKFDDENVENWKGGADGILVFTGLFSSTVATFIAMSYPNLHIGKNPTR